jgi:hypothetical protein
MMRTTASQRHGARSWLRISTPASDLDNAASPLSTKKVCPVPLMCENKSHHATAQNAVGVENNDRFTHHHSDLTLAGG